MQNQFDRFLIYLEDFFDADSIWHLLLLELSRHAQDKRLKSRLADTADRIRPAHTIQNLAREVGVTKVIEIVLERDNQLLPENSNRCPKAIREELIALVAQDNSEL